MNITYKKNSTVSGAWELLNQYISDLKHKCYSKSIIRVIYVLKAKDHYHLKQDFASHLFVFK